MITGGEMTSELEDSDQILAESSFKILTSLSG
jgi:hypothetical protein